MTEKRYRVFNHDDYELDYIADSKNNYKKVDLYDCCDLLNENEQLKQFIQELTTKGTGKIHLANGNIYKVNAILTDFNR